MGNAENKKNDGSYLSKIKDTTSAIAKNNPIVDHTCRSSPSSLEENYRTSKAIVIRRSSFEKRQWVTSSQEDREKIRTRK